MSSQRVIIVDVPVSDNIRQGLIGFGLRLIDADEATIGLMSWNGWSYFEPERTLLLFPGNGANDVRRRLCLKWLKVWPFLSLPAKRVLVPDHCYPWTLVGSVAPRMLLGLNDVVVVDDVISSGVTCRQLRRNNFPWIPGTRWHAVTWVIQRAAKLKGFEEVHGAYEVGTLQTMVPINSLSTLLTDQEVADAYVRRNISRPGEFLALLDIARQRDDPATIR